MNKTVTINISGIIFHIEEDAYQRLQDYLAKVRNKFSSEEGREEIMMDIESRIAEILSEKTGPFKQVVLLADVEQVISMMGEAEEIGGDSSSANANATTAEDEKDNDSERRYRRRLYRDPDDKVIGGVCSGLGYYFDIDHVWIRLGFAILFFVFGTGLLFYILLMIIIPKAVTTAEKLEMRGEPVDINNIGKTIKEEFEEFGAKAKRKGEEWKKRGKEWKQEYDWRRRRSSGSGRYGADDFFHGVFRVMGRLIAFALIFFGILFLIGLLTSTFSLTTFGPHFIASTFKGLFSSGTDYGIAITSILLVFGIPILMMIYKGIRMMFRIQFRDRYIGISALCLWIIGIALIIYSGFNAAKSFAEETTVTENVAIPTTGLDTLYLSVSPDTNMRNPDYYSKWNRKYHYARRNFAISINGEDVRLGDPHLHIVPSSNDSTQLIIFKSSHGCNMSDATKNAEAISFPVEIRNGRITFTNYFNIGKNGSWRDQAVDVELRLPKGKVVYLAPSTVDMLDDIDNLSKTVDNDMIDRRWQMTAAGLKCIDCAGLDETMGDKTNQLPVKTDSLPH